METHVDIQHVKAKLEHESEFVDKEQQASWKQDLFELEQAGGLAKFAVHGDRSLIIGIGGGDGGAVKLGLEKGAIHGRKGNRMRKRTVSARTRCRRLAEAPKSPPAGESPMCCA